MGFGGLSSQVIMFIAVITVSTALIMIFNNYIDTSTTAMVAQQNFLSSQIKTDITIDLINYENGTRGTYFGNVTTLYAQNTGSTILDITLLDVYLGGIRYVRTYPTGCARSISPDSDTINIGKWDPKEVLVIVCNHTYSSNNVLAKGTTYEAVILSQYGTKTVEQFSTPAVNN